jgi:hypothetical protein
VESREWGDEEDKGNKRVILPQLSQLLLLISHEKSDLLDIFLLDGG